MPRILACSKNVQAKQQKYVVQAKVIEQHYNEVTVNIKSFHP